MWQRAIKPDFLRMIPQEFWANSNFRRPWIKLSKCAKYLNIWQNTGRGDLKSLILKQGRDIMLAVLTTFGCPMKTLYLSPSNYCTQFPSKLLGTGNLGHCIWQHTCLFEHSTTPFKISTKAPHLSRYQPKLLVSGGWWFSIVPFHITFCHFLSDLLRGVYLVSFSNYSKKSLATRPDKISGCCVREAWCTNKTYRAVVNLLSCSNVQRFSNVLHQD